MRSTLILSLLLLHPAATALSAPCVQPPPLQQGGEEDPEQGDQPPAGKTPPQADESGAPGEGEQEEQAHIRLLRDEEGSPQAFQTAVTRYVSDEGELVVDLVSAVHFGDADYYRGLNEWMAQYDVLLYELVAPPGMERPTLPTEPRDGLLTLLPRLARSVFGFESQLSLVDYRAENFVHADLSLAGMQAAMAKRGEDGLTLVLGILADSIRQSNKRSLEMASRDPDETPLFDPLQALMDPDGALQFKVWLAGELTRQVGTGALGRTLDRLLITDRNAAAMKVFQKQLAQGKKRIGIFYGAAHMPDFERRLVDGYGLTREQVLWRTAWSLEPPEEPGKSTLLELISDELTRDLWGSEDRSR